MVFALLVSKPIIALNLLIGFRRPVCMANEFSACEILCPPTHTPHGSRPSPIRAELRDAKREAHSGEPVPPWLPAQRCVLLMEGVPGGGTAQGSLGAGRLGLDVGAGPRRIQGWTQPNPEALQEECGRGVDVCTFFRKEGLVLSPSLRQNPMNMLGPDCEGPSLPS